MRGALQGWGSFMFFLFNMSTIFGQSLIKLTQLPPVVEETSGIEVTDINEVWTFNDSGGTTELFLCDTLGNLLGTYAIPEIRNRDWEDMAQDDSGNFYVGDIGNNANARRDLVIYRFPRPTLGTVTDIQEIFFSFEDQSEFPPSNLQFDCESVFWFQNHLYLFTKHRSLPMSTKVYRIPDSSGTYIAKPMDEFFTGTAAGNENPIADYWITAADISPDGKQVVLLSSNKVFLFSNFSSDDFFGAKVDTVNLGESTQKEGICFRNNSQLYLTDEYWSTNDVGRNLYLLQLPPNGSSSIEVDSSSDLSVYPIPSSHELQVELDRSNLLDQIELYNLNLELVKRVDKEDFLKGAGKISIEELPNGTYVLQVRFIDGSLAVRTISIVH